jgi:hypothetical protein
LLPGFFFLFSFFFFEFCDVTILAIKHPQKELIKFFLERKVEKFKNPAMFWRPAGTYCLNMAISKKQFVEIW